ncbi:hypothetical protein Sango_0923200 [Sesamum angolense]|uniref:K-box domain-containing protein n=1 Tax=Sesamum angolense TaxID=2727404 RepID=A0AAE2BY69_9LAMI|nr:hypothetical protein Sango_0923200 [Sesamum angolense]
MMQLIQRHSLQSEKSNKLGQQPLHIQATYGEELQGLGMSDLMKLEKLVETGLSRVGKTKRQKLGCARNGMEQGNSADSITNSHQDLVHRPDEDSDTSLKLAYLSPNCN